MRVEPYGVDSFVHVVKRGARGLPITRDEADCGRFVRLLYYMNDKNRRDFWERELAASDRYSRPRYWPKQRPLVKILAWTLMPNHFHLLLKEIQDGGIARFMQGLCGSMSRHFNEKYDEKGSIFQGSYRSRTIDNDAYLRWVVPYILVKNVFELYPGGFKRAVKEFDKAWKWGTEEYKFSSLGDFARQRSSPIVDEDILSDLLTSTTDFKRCAREVIDRKLEKIQQLEGSVLFE